MGGFTRILRFYRHGKLHWLQRLPNFVIKKNATEVTFLFT